MSWIENYAENRSAKSAEFKEAYDEERFLIALIRARNQAGLTQKDVAEKLGVTQPRIAQVERGTRPMSASFLIRYADAVGVTIELKPKGKAS